MQRRRVASAVIAVCVAMLAGGWTFEDGMEAGSRHRASFQQSLPPRQALYSRILAELDRITEVQSTADCGPPKGPAISCAGVYQPQGASLPTTSGFRVLDDVEVELPDGVTIACRTMEMPIEGVA